ncbi:hypothetical protein CLV59_109274 [Chitinophaga dinghuensis]|uniref:Uncharacterized protein n=1 Tax=Chitinophaga dinghuensis TaxID=1539050 RepID=A0A327VLM6_9BACT|nr:hypothetical protein [Chitinophaga dinghuensis]RAJ75660.1 hypothetical protein CLV59_109274 [Chitinophaga dinghuensis]
MNKKPLFVTVLSALTVAGIFLASSCKKDQHGGRPVLAGTIAGCGDSTIHGVITSDLYLQACKTYTLDSLVYVSNGAKLTIQAGTTIKGALGSGKEGGYPGGGLIITRGSKIIAEGTASNPIIFTSASNNPKSGDWAGVVILGRATTNWPSLTRVEGIPGTPLADANYGDPNVRIDNDNSGILKYVRIEYAGYALSANNEINGLTLAGVGSGTVLDYIEVYKAADDAFEFFGGTVNASHLVAVDALDDMFDTDNGYTGSITYALGLSDTTRADQSQSNGFESDNDAQGSNNTPITRPKYNYVTIVGVPSASLASIANGQPSGSGKYGRAAHLRRNTEFEISNSIFTGFRWGISLDYALGNTLGKYNAGVDVFCNNYVDGFQIPTSKELNFTSFAAIAMTVACTSNQTANSTDPNDFVQLNSPFVRVPNDPFNYQAFVASPAASAGAFATDATWADSWTRF